MAPPDLAQELSHLRTKGGALNSRREFLVHCSAAIAVVLWPRHREALMANTRCHELAPLAASSNRFSAWPRDLHRAVQHPTPRPGITGAKVLTKAQLAARADLVPLFDGIRAIPEIADGIGCHCGCALLDGYYSLLSCYEGDAMAKICPICKGQGKLTVRLRAEGKSLDEIRVAVDAQFG